MDINSIFETNILNLIVVIGIVVKVIGGAATDFLNDRKCRIERRFIADKERSARNDLALKDAQTRLTNAQKERSLVEHKSMLDITQAEKTMIESLDHELRRLETENALTVQRKKQDTVETIGQILVKLSIKKAENPDLYDYCYSSLMSSKDFYLCRL